MIPKARFLRFRQNVKASNANTKTGMATPIPALKAVVLVVLCCWAVVPLEVGIAVAACVISAELAVLWREGKVLLDRVPSEGVVVVTVLEASVATETAVELAVLDVEGIGTCSVVILLELTEVGGTEVAIDVLPGLEADEVPVAGVMGLPIEMEIPTEVQAPRTKSKLVA